ncbi:hypothetical protein QBC46DRAFT_428932 [Diplogelasinospora grovesii]|uniref:Uncharacterized protein n=1 Tax=Diplogelasinospora grovesii TaxID=303347 RepID=A0AAN6MVC9_9PEZI|nr:hypothetical protein QBC46DRAFT_428932 [Diplogelasinospora grovesii]
MVSCPGTYIINLGMRSPAKRRRPHRNRDGGSSSDSDCGSLRQGSSAVPPPPSTQNNDLILYRLTCLDGDHLVDPPRKSQLRHSFSQNDPADFNIDIDSRVRKIHPIGIRIHSPHVQAVLRALIRYYPGFDVQDSEISFIHPFKELFHYWKDLQDILRSGRDEEESKVVIRNSDTGSEVRIACDSPTYEHLETLLTAPPVQDAWDTIVQPELDQYGAGCASYDCLWLLFKPGEMVFARTRNTGKKLAGFVVMRVTHQSRINRWELVMWNLAYDNGRLRRRAHTVYVDRFHGERAITDLPVFPTKFAPSQEALRAQLIECGKRYYRIISDGQSHMRYNGSVIAKKEYHYQGEIIVDHQSYKLEALDSPNMEMPDILGEEPEDLGGEPLFSKFNDMECSAANELEPAQYLKGPPGTGKTLTVELIAKKTRRPLAEVYLEQRQTGHINRNALVTVLLSAITLARYECLQEAASAEPSTEIEVTAKHLETVLKNKEEFNNDYKLATGFYPDQMAAERFFRAESRPEEKR